MPDFNASTIIPLNCLHPVVPKQETHKPLLIFETTVNGSQPVGGTTFSWSHPVHHFTADPICRRGSEGWSVTVTSSSWLGLLQSHLPLCQHSNFQAVAFILTGESVINSIAATVSDPQGLGIWMLTVGSRGWSGRNFKGKSGLLVCKVWEPLVYTMRWMHWNQNCSLCMPHAHPADVP